MSKLKISAKELRTLGYPESPVIPVAMNVMEKHFKHHTKEAAFEILKAVLQSPKDYANDEILQSIAEKLLPKALSFGEGLGEVALNKTGIHFNIFGRDQIEEGAMHQMYAAAKLPVSVAGALMPDAHHGYGLPIGGVLATENAVIPYGVGVDIGCRMCLSVFDIRPEELDNKLNYFAGEINENTLFGAGKGFEKFADHEVLERKEFYETAFLRSLQS